MRSGLAVPERLSPAYSLLVAAFAVALNYFVGPNVEFPGLFLVPVVFAAWYGGMTWALPMSLLPFTRVLMLMAADTQVDLYPIVLSTIVRAIVFVPIALWVATVAASQRALRHEVEMLEGLLPICSYCKKIRDDAGEWQVVEKYIQDRSAATFSHGICDPCLREQEELWQRHSAG